MAVAHSPAPLQLDAVAPPPPQPRAAGPAPGETGVRLPSISALLNAPDPQPSEADPSASTSSRPHPPPSHYPAVVTACAETANDAGVAFSQSRRIVRPASPPSRQLTSLEFPDGNALHPLPSGLSASNGRPRAASVSHGAHYDGAAYGRLPGFATSSERGGAAHGEEVLDGRERYQDASAGPAHRLEVSRPRALSISSTEEYRAQLGWNGAVQHEQRLAGRPDLYARPSTAQPAFSAPQYAYLSNGSASYPPFDRPPAQHQPPQEGWAPHLMHSYPPQHPHHAAPSRRHDLQNLVPLSIPSGLPLAGPTSPPNPAAHQYPSHPAGASGPPNWAGAPPSALPAGQVSAAAPAEPAQDAGRYGCPHCPKRFARPSSLRIHMHSHTGEKPFTCPMCDRAFSVQSNLRRHLKIHKGGNGAPAAASSASAPRFANASDGRAVTSAEDGTMLPSPVGESDASSATTSAGLGRRGSAEQTGSASATAGGTDGEADDHAIEEEDEPMVEGEQLGAKAAAAAVPAEGGAPAVRTAWPRAE
ncbi:hypothetical protein JCM10450v2_004392 [Rhodotorula kratochvilovae]